MRRICFFLLCVALLLPGAPAALPNINEYCQELLFEDQTCDYYAENGFFFGPSYNFGSGTPCENYWRCRDDPQVKVILNDMVEIAKLERKYENCNAACEGSEDYFACSGACEAYYDQADALRDRTVESEDPNYWGLRALCVYGFIASECCSEFSGFPTDCGASTVVVSPELCDNGVDDDGDTLIDCADDDCATAPNCVFTVAGSVVTGGYKPLANVKVALMDSSNSEIVSGYTDDAGVFTLDYTAMAAVLGVPDTPVIAYLRVYLEDKDGMFRIIWDFVGENRGYTVDTQEFPLPTNQRYDIVLGSGNALLSEDNKVEGEGWDSHWDASNVYYEAKRFFDFVGTELGYGFNGGGNSLPVKIYVYTSESDSSAFYSPVRKGGGVFLPPWKSSHNNPMCPENCLWHELFHFTMYNKYGSWAQENSPYENHAGFKNNNTGDSFEESFAEFWPNVLASELNGDTAHLYANVWNMELNYNPWVKEGRYEEFAMATLLWDMWDSEEDKGEKMSVSYKPLWDVLMGQSLRSFKEVYDALKAKWPEKAAEIDSLFVAHGIFKDTNPGNSRYDEGEPYWDKDPDGSGPLNASGTWDAGEDFVDIGTPDDEFGRPHQVYTPGEEIGTTTNYARPTRESKPLDESSFVRIGVTSNGASVDDAIFKVSYSFSDPSLNYVNYGVVDEKTSYVYVEMPPDEYQMTASITADNYEGGQPITVTPDDYYAAKATGADYMKSGTISAGAKKADYCNNDKVCGAGESQNCGDCRAVASVPPGGTMAPPATAADSSIIWIVVLIIIAFVVVIAVVLLKGHKPAAKVAAPVNTSGFCPMCGAAIPTGSAFCPNCGKKAS